MAVGIPSSAAEKPTLGAFRMRSLAGTMTGSSIDAEDTLSLAPCNKVAELSAEASGPTRKKDWRRTIGIFKDDPDFEEAVRLGREYRQQQTYEKEIAGS